MFYRFTIIVVLLIVSFNISSCNVVDDNTPQNENIDTSHGIVYPLMRYQIIQAFSNINGSFNNKYHCAHDLQGTGGTPVYSIMDGVVSYSDHGVGYGWLITIDHPEADVYSLYGHMSSRREKVAQGDTVHCGEIIGYIADDDEDGSGETNGTFTYPYWSPHLHFSIRNGKISDYPGTGDTRWEAGYTEEMPTMIGWLNPLAYIMTVMGNN